MKTLLQWYVKQRVPLGHTIFIEDRGDNLVGHSDLRLHSACQRVEKRSGARRTHREGK